MSLSVSYLLFLLSIWSLHLHSLLWTGLSHPQHAAHSCRSSLSIQSHILWPKHWRVLHLIICTTLQFIPSLLAVMQNFPYTVSLFSVLTFFIVYIFISIPFFRSYSPFRYFQHQKEEKAIHCSLWYFFSVTLYSKRRGVPRASKFLRHTVPYSWHCSSCLSVHAGNVTGVYKGRMNEREGMMTALNMHFYKCHDMEIDS